VVKGLLYAVVMIIASVYLTWPWPLIGISWWMKFSLSLQFIVSL